MRPYFDKNQAGRVRSRRNRTARFQIALWIAVLALLSLGFTWGWQRCLRSGAFDLRTVTISGNRTVRSSQLLALVRPALGQPVWNVNKSKTSAGICRKFPAVKKVGYRLWPWGRMDLLITERTAVARLETDDGSVISEEGIIFPDSTGQGLPAIRISGTSQDGRNRAITMIMAAPRADGSWLVDPSAEDDIRLVLDSTTVHFGNGRFPEKWQRLGQILADLQRNGIAAAEIDLRFDRQVIVSKCEVAELQSAPTAER
jgi:cell division septal protein FtsQ